jgi:hypothetical protein
MRNISKALTVVSLAALSTLIATSSIADDRPAATLLNRAQPILVNPTSSSGPAEIALAEHLSKNGAIMYGLNSCPYCRSQKQRFGTTAWPKIKYVECVGNGVALCNKANVRVTPTWFIKGAYYPGELSLFKLAKISGYAGATNFKNN